MKRALPFGIASLALAGGLAAASPMLQRYDGRRDYGRGSGGPPPGYVRHDDWRRGRRMPRDYWGRAQRVDYRRYRLSRPPRGYEWRQVDGNFVLAAVTTGLIASVIAATAAQQ